MRFSLILSLLLSVFMTVFALLNTDPVTVDFGFFEATGPTALVLLLTFVLGIIVGLLLMVPVRRKRKRKQRAQTLSSSAPSPSADAGEPADPAQHTPSHLPRP